MLNIPELSGKYEEDLPRIKQFFDEVASSLEVENFDGEQITHTFSLAGVPEAVHHNLEREPRRFQVLNIDKAATVHKTAGTVDDISLSASEDGTTVTFFVT